MDDTDRQLLSYLQGTIPLHTRPFEILGKAVGLDGAEVILRIIRLKEQKVLGRITAVFDRTRWGYQTTLVAMQIPEGEWHEAWKTVCSHPAVSYAYQRRHTLNLWFHLSLPASDSLKGEVEKGRRFLNAQQVLLLPALKFYKRGRPVEGRDDEFERTNARMADRWELHGEKAPSLSELEVEVIRVLQEDFPLADEPFRRMAQRVGVSEQQFFETLKLLKERRYLGKITASANRRTDHPPESHLWVVRVPEEKETEVAKRLALCEEVRVCSKRPASAEFPYTIHATVRCTETRKEPTEKWDRIKEIIGPWPSKCLPVITEFKNEGFRLFPKDSETRWGHEALGIAGKRSASFL